MNLNGLEIIQGEILTYPEKGYSRHACSLFRVMRKMGYYVNKEKRTKYIPKHYNTPKQIGIKWQLDVKYVPKDCYSGNDDQKFYQYTVIDEASRERFIYPYKEQSSYSKNNPLIQLLILSKELSSTLITNLKLFKPIMVKNLHIHQKLIEFIRLICSVYH